MGEAFLDQEQGTLTVSSLLVLYGNFADEALAGEVAGEVESAWNQPDEAVTIAGGVVRVRFSVQGRYVPGTTADDIHENLDPRINFFRVEDFCRLHISFVDEIGSNTGYLLLDNLTNHSLTAAHEYGHTLGLAHPRFLDIRGQGQPGIMYPRGTWVDPVYQWDPEVPAGVVGGTLNPAKRKVLGADIRMLGLEHLVFDRRGRAVVGAFTNLYHQKH